jgi:peptidoglycan/xylan/chitin deacetylase (PgdA/CDA1 family)
MSPMRSPAVLCVVLTGALIAAGPGPVERRDGGVVRGGRDGKRIALEFTGHEFAEGGAGILDQLARHRARASFFLTGDFARHAEFAPLIARMVREGHYVGPHSDKHLLYCSWEPGKKTLVSRPAFVRDVEDNLAALARRGVRRESARYFLPAYEWYNADIAAWSAGLGLTLVNFTPGTRSNADYTGEADANFVSSAVVLASILDRERAPDGLNGFLLLMHVGAGPGRRDKMHDRLGELLDALAARGYEFVRIDELLR